MARKKFIPIEFEEQRKSPKALWGIDILTLARMIVSAFSFALGLVFAPGGMARLICMLLSFLASGYGVVAAAVEKLLTQRTMDEKLLLIAASFLSFILRAEVDGAAVMLLYSLTALAFQYVADRTRRSVMQTVDPRSGSAIRLGDEGEELVSVSALKPGDTILLRPGDVAAVDGVVLDGYSTVDFSSVDGRKDGVMVEEGDTVPSGARNITSQLQLEVASNYNSSTMDRMWQFICSDDEPTRWEDLLNRYYRLFAAIAVALTAVLTVLFTLLHSEIGVALHRAMVVLIIANPASFAAALFWTYFTGMHGVAHRGILFKGHAAMEKAADCKAIIFDQDGTVTTMDYRVSAIHANRIDSRILLKASAHAAANASSQQMRAIVNAYGGPVDYSIIGNFIEYPEGISVSIEGVPVLAGSRDFLLQNSIPLGEADALETPAVHVSLGGQFAGSLLLANSVQEGCEETMAELDHLGCRDVVLLSEDSGEKAAVLAQQCGIHKYYPQCLPMDKLARVREIRERNRDGATVYVAATGEEGAAFAGADAGMYLGGLNGEGALEAQIIAMDGHIALTAEALRSAQLTQRVLTQGLLGAAVVKGLLLLLTLLGLNTSLWFAALLDGFAAIGVVLNAVRAFPPEK